VCSVVHFSHAESLRDAVLAAEIETGVNVVTPFTSSGVVFNTQTIEPEYSGIAHVTDTLKRHR